MHQAVKLFSRSHAQRMLLQRADAPVLVARQCLAPTYVGDFHLRGAELRREGLNRIGNMLVPNSNYCAFEDWIMPVFEAMLREQQEQGTHWTPSSVRETLGQTAHRGPGAVVVHRVNGLAASRQCC
jgi:Deoxyhypusine synthase